MAAGNKNKKSSGGMETLSARLKAKEIGGVYLFTGDENYLKQHYLGMLRKLAVTDGTEFFNLHEMDAQNFSCDALCDAVNSVPVMSERSLTVVRDVELARLRDEKYAAVLEETFSDFPPEAVVVFLYVTAEPGPKTDLKKHRGLAAVLKDAVTVDFSAPGEAQLASWIKKHFAADNTPVSADTVRYLMEVADCDMLSLTQEIEKLIHAAAGREVTRAMIDSVTTRSLDSQIYLLTGALAERNVRAAMGYLDEFFERHMEPLYVLAAVGNHFSQLLLVKLAMKNKVPPDRLATDTGMKEYPLRKARDAAAKLPEPFLRRMVALCAEADTQLKNSRSDPRIVLERIAAGMAEIG